MGHGAATMGHERVQAMVNESGWAAEHPNRRPTPRFLLYDSVAFRESFLICLAKAMGMRTRHRIEVLRHQTDAFHEAWRSQDGSVSLLRKRGESGWRAVVDRHAVLDADRINGPMAWAAAPGEEPEPWMEAGSPAELARRLAAQDAIHCIFDRPLQDADA
jgi:hypothetical protein